jgi:hypothetical protein
LAAPSRSAIDIFSIIVALAQPLHERCSPFERGGASTGQALAALPNEIRRAVREEVQRYFGGRGGPIESETEYRIASGRR